MNPLDKELTTQSISVAMNLTDPPCKWISLLKKIYIPVLN